MKEASIYSNQSLIAYNQAAKIRQPGKGAFNFPSFPIASEFSAILRFCLFPIAPVWNNQIDFKLFQPLTKWITIVTFIGNQTQRALSGTTATIARYTHRFKSFFGKRYFRGRCRGKGASDRNTLAVDHHHPLRSFAPFGRANKGPPFLAGAKLPSMKASCQSSAPFSSSMARNLRQTSSQIPCSSQSLNLRQQEDGLGYLSGRSCQRAPVRSTQRIPSRTSLLSIEGRPPFGFRFGLGSSGSINFHRSSFMKRVFLAIGHLPTA